MSLRFFNVPVRDSENVERERNGSLSNYSAKVQGQQEQSPTTKDTIIAPGGLSHIRHNLVVNFKPKEIPENKAGQLG